MAMTDSSFKKQNTDVPRGARTNLLALTAGLAFTLLAVGPTANAGEREHGMKQGSHKTLNAQPGAQKRRGPGQHAQGRHREPVEAVECGDVLSVAGNYSLNSDLVCTTPINVTGSNVHLDLAGHSISCDAANWEFTAPDDVSVRYPQIVAGIFVNAHSALEWEESGSGFEGIPQAPVLTGFKVKNGTIADCTFGMYFFKTDRSKVRNMHLDRNNVARPQFNGASAGVTTFFSNDNDFIDNHVSDGSLNGFELTLSNGNRLRGNLLEGATDDGIILIGSKGNVIRKNTVVDNPFGIYVTFDFETFELSTGNVIASNHVSGNTDEGITLLGPTNDNIVRANTVTDNGGYGVLLLGLAPFELPVPAGNKVRGNIATGNSLADLAEADLGDDFETPVIPAEC
jgi:parallel beta-helix repeat protein